MNEQIVYVPVSVEDELPVSNNSNSEYLFTDNGEMYYRGKQKAWYFGGQSVACESDQPKTWLKPIPLSSLLKEKDEQIKELKAALWEIAFADSMLEMAEIANLTLQKHNSINEKIR